MSNYFYNVFFFLLYSIILLSVLQMMIKVLACLSYATTYYETEYYLCSQCRVVVGIYRKKIAQLKTTSQATFI